MRDADTIAGDLVVEIAQSVAIGIDGESRYPPDQLAESWRAYHHDGRSSVARPLSQEKSQPVTSAASPMAMNSSNE